jgi:hypothetical protein
MRETPTLTHALHFWRRGLSVIPVPRPRPNVPPGQPADGSIAALEARLESSKKCAPVGDIDWQGRFPLVQRIRSKARIEGRGSR